jgi:hypothetical protein
MEQATVAGPVNDCFAHEKSLMVGADIGSGPNAGLSVITSVSVTPSAFPVIVTRTGLVTASVTAVKSADFVPVSTTTAAGSFRAASLLDRATGVEVVAAALK